MALPTQDLRCSKCGQAMQITMTDVLNQLAPAFCPMCGTRTLARSQHILAVQDRRMYAPEAAFHTVDERLVALLYQNWRYYDAKDNKHVKQPHRFVDYLKEQLDGS